MIYLCMLFYPRDSGLPAVVYLTMNKTLRNDVRRMFARAMGMNQVSSYAATKVTGAEASRSQVTDCHALPARPDSRF